jgi:quinol monooxygenase YgiN
MIYYSIKQNWWKTYNLPKEQVTIDKGGRFERNERRQLMVRVGLFVRLEAKPGKEIEVEEFLRGGLEVVQQEPATAAWFAIRLGPSTFGIFDAFPDEAGRQAHLSGKVAAALMAKAPELLSQPPVIEKLDVLAVKLPG